MKYIQLCRKGYSKKKNTSGNTKHAFFKKEKCSTYRSNSRKAHSDTCNIYFDENKPNKHTKKKNY